MKTFKFEVDLDAVGEDEVVINCIGDVHLGTKNASKSKFELALQETLKKRNAFMLGMGDYTDSIIPTDKRFDLRTLDGTEIEFQDMRWNLQEVDGQHIYLEKALEKLGEAKKIIGLHAGNHGGKMYKMFSYDGLKRICGEIGCEYLTHGSALWSLRLKRGKKIVKDWTFYSCHGNGGGWTLGAPVNRQMRNFSSFMADAYVMGHTHRLMCWPVSRLDVSRAHGRFTAREMISWFGQSGSFYLTYIPEDTSYAEVCEYSPLVRGYLKVVCSEDELYMVPRVMRD